MQLKSQNTDTNNQTHHAISHAARKKHGISAFLTASRRERKTSQKEQNPMLIFPKFPILRTATVEIIFFARFPCCSMCIIER